LTRCPHCNHVAAATFAICPACGAAAGDTATTVDDGGHASTVPAGDEKTTVPAGDEKTTVPAGATKSTRRGSATGGSRGLSGSSRSRGPERFAPGTLLHERYRILSLIGTGGMGEVYRAEDLTLDQEVALKFLPEAFGADEDRRRRFLQEVRLARQIAHPSVCRVYDVGEVDGHLYLSMEFVEGADLSSVLRSIGRFPEEKALDLARQLCAGLAALHDRGVLHRDFKPANIMLDGEGRVRITDFGLAGAADQFKGAEVRSGTPAYMAPEQLEGREVTERSDIYALGLVLYEIFSGRAAFTADTVEKITELHRSVTPSRISSHVSDIDPAVERVIARCLEKDPARRPSSALTVSTALPGGDPLAAALAMGETPSPELVAAAGGLGGIHPALGLALLGIAVLGLLIQAGLGRDLSLPQHIDMDRSADALEERARQLVVSLGYDERPVDRYRCFARAGDRLNWIAEQDSTRERWTDLANERPAPLLFWYRQAPVYLLTRDSFGRVTPSDPAPLLADMLQVTLDARGRLVYFSAVPPESLTTILPGADVFAAPGDGSIDLRADVPAAGDESGTDRGNEIPLVTEETWNLLFTAAELDRADFTAVESQWIPDQFVLERRAWRGTTTSAEREIAITVEAGGLGGKVVYFRVHGPWSGDHRTVRNRPQADRWEVLIVVIVLGVLGAGVTLALRNHRLGRTDTRGAGKLAAVLLLMPVVRWLFALHHAPLPNALLARFFDSLAVGALYAMICLMLYLALEPYVRRIWPHALIGWSRLAAGAWRDPMVGRSILVGGALFGISSVLTALQGPLREAFGAPPPNPASVNWWALATPRVLVGDFAIQLPNSLFNALFFLMLLVLLRLLLRRPWLSYLTFVVITGLIISLDTSDWRLGIINGAVIASLWTLVLVRAGIFAFVIGFYLTQMADNYPLTFDFPQMYAGTSLIIVASIVLVMVLALGSALAGRSLLRSDLETH